MNTSSPERPSDTPAVPEHLRQLPPFQQRQDLTWLADTLESIPDELWQTKVVRSQDTDGKITNCVFGHVFDLGGGDDPEPSISQEVGGGSLLWSWFEENVATTFRMYLVNDGEDPDYQQPTPRERCVAYTRAVRDGRELTTYESMSAECDWNEGVFATLAEARQAQLAARGARDTAR